MAAKQEHDGVSVPTVEEMSYTEASDELDEIVRFFEDREVDVDQLVGRLVRATAIIEEMDKRLRRTRVQVEQLVPKLTKVLSANDELADDELADDELADDELADDEVDGALVDKKAVQSQRTRAADADTAALF